MIDGHVNCHRICQIMAAGVLGLASFLFGTGAAAQSAKSQQPRRLSCGVAQVDITPDYPARIAGAYIKRFAERVLDPLYAKAVVFSDGTKKVCFVSVDVTIITAECSARIRGAASGIGFDRDAVMIHATQTHTAPALGNFHLDPEFNIQPSSGEWLRGAESRYVEFAIPRIVEAIRQANADLQPVSVSTGRAIEGRVAFNRRAVIDDGSGVFMPRRTWPLPLGPTRMSHLEGPIDPEVAVLVIRGTDGKIRSMLLHHTCHPVSLMGQMLISADWPGAWSRTMKDVAGSQCLPVVVNGCCGNINPWNPFDPEYKDDHERMGRTLAKTTSNLLAAKDHLRSIGEPIVDFASESIVLPIRKVPPDQLAHARDVIRQHPEIQWADKEKTRVDYNWYRAAMLVCLDLQRRREKHIDYEIQVLRIGNAAIVGLPGEPFVEGQLAIKQASPAARTIIAHCVNQYVGYIPTRRAFQYPEGRRGHEVNTSTWAKLEPDALDRIVAETNVVLRRMFQPAESK